MPPRTINRERKHINLKIYNGEEKRKLVQGKDWKIATIPAVDQREIKEINKEEGK